MSGTMNHFLQQVGTGDQIKDYQHGARTFVDSNYRLSPKMASLFHVYIDINPTIAPGDFSEVGLLAKAVSLPKFSVQTKTYNAYNRKNIAQERINYDPITISFHDDSANVIKNFWKGYYSFYYRDADHQEPLYNMESKYRARQTQNWGFSPTQKGSGTPNYINAIRIYSMHQKQFTSYTLIRPTITSFQHGQHTQGDYAPLESTMTIAYEAVQYGGGYVSPGSVRGFNRGHYDNTASPLSAKGGGTKSILGPGGLVSGISDAMGDLQSGNFIGAAIGGLRTFNNAKNMDLKTVASAELKQTAMNILRGQNTQSTVFVPTQASIQAGLSKAVNSIQGLVGVKKSNSGNMNPQG